MNRETSDVIYYNINIGNSKLVPIIANYSEQRTIPLLHNPSEYYLSIIRFSVPGLSVPILVCPVTNAPTTPLQTPYSVTLLYNTGSGFLTYTQKILYYPRDNFQNLSVPPLDPQNPYYFIYEYQHFLDLVNIALQTATTNLIGLGAPADLLSPYFIFDEVTQLISLIAPLTGITPPSTPTTNDYYSLPSSAINTYTPAVPSGKVGIFVNDELFPFFQGIETIHVSDSVTIGPDYWLIVKNNGNNYYQSPATAPVYPPVFLQMQQQANTLNNWNSFQSLAFLSNSLPTLKEFTPVYDALYNGNTQSGANMNPILTDFVPLLENAGDQRGSFVYNPTGPYRLVNLLSNDPIYAVDISVVWFDQYNRQYPIVLEPGQSITIKIMFVKKSSYRYPYN
jgi:hypothetical protein